VRLCGFLTRPGLIRHRFHWRSGPICSDHVHVAARALALIDMNKTLTLSSVGRICHCHACSNSCHRARQVGAEVPGGPRWGWLQPRAVLLGQLCPTAAKTARCRSRSARMLALSGPECAVDRCGVSTRGTTDMPNPPPVLAYLLGMPAPKRPAPEDTVTARQILLDGLSRDADIFDLAGELAPLHPRNNTFPGEVFCTWPPTRSAGVAPAAPARCPWRGSGTASCPSAHSAVGKTRSSGMPCWPRQPFMAGPNPTCSTRLPGGRPTTSGNTRCSQPSPTSAPPPAGQAYPCPRNAGNSPSTPARCPAELGRMLQAPATERPATGGAAARHEGRRRTNRTAIRACRRR